MSSNNLFSIPEEQRSRTSDVIASLIDRLSDKQITLRNLTNQLGDRTFGMLLVLSSILAVIPFISIIGGLLISILGIQMVFGRTKAWLPKVILDKTLPNQSLLFALRSFEPRIRTIERHVYPRLHFTEAPIIDRINGLILSLLGLVIALPIPFANFPLTLIVIVMGLGLLERDGALQIAAATLGLLSMYGVYYLITH
jgi:hypothetical protein